MPHPAFEQTDHRPWPLPKRRPVMAMRWLDLLFAHWPVASASLVPHLPAGLALDTFEGQAYLGVVPFRMSGVRPLGTPPLPGVSAFPELNVRTYVTAGGKPGVWFFSLDAGSRLAVRAARRFFHLPYFDADLACEEGGGWVGYRSRRTHRGAPAAEWGGRYRPAGEVFRARPGSLEHWLTERYCLYAAAGDGRLLRCEIQHPPWPLQPAQAVVGRDTLTASLGPERAAEPSHLLFARRLEVVAWWPEVL
jgi:hypothetical protein